jgi:adenylate kinase family enzyme
MKKKLPVTIIFCGPPGSGKSTCIKFLRNTYVFRKTDIRTFVLNYIKKNTISFFPTSLLNSCYMDFLNRIKKINPDVIEIGNDYSDSFLKELPKYINKKKLLFLILDIPIAISKERMKKRKFPTPEKTILKNYPINIDKIRKNIILNSNNKNISILHIKNTSKDEVFQKILNEIKKIEK